MVGKRVAVVASRGGGRGGRCDRCGAGVRGGGPRAGADLRLLGRRAVRLAVGGGTVGAGDGRLCLSWDPERYLDPQWLRFPRFVLTALRGFSGVMKGEAVERLFDDRLRRTAVGELPNPLATIVYNTDLGLTEYLGTVRRRRCRSDASCGSRSRCLRSSKRSRSRSPVRRRWRRGVLPIQPVLDRGPFDHVFGLNFMLPERFTPDDITGWHRKPMGIVLASRELQQAYHVEFARRASASSATR